MKKLNRIIFYLVLFQLGLSRVLLFSADDIFCRDYANQSVKQYAEAMSKGCSNLQFPRWSEDSNHHYNWCIKVDANAAKAEINRRQFFIDACSGPHDYQGHSKDECQRYASTAVSQNKFNTTNKCGLKGPLWHDNYDQHYQWCMGKYQHETTAATNQRQNLLSQCKPGDPKSFQIQPIKMYATELKFSSLFTPPIIPGSSVFYHRPPTDSELDVNFYFLDEEKVKVGSQWEKKFFKRPIVPNKLLFTITNVSNQPRKVKIIVRLGEMKEVILYETPEEMLAPFATTVAKYDYNKALEYNSQSKRINFMTFAFHPTWTFFGEFIVQGKPSDFRAGVLVYDDSHKGWDRNAMGGGVDALDNTKTIIPKYYIEAR